MQHTRFLTQYKKLYRLLESGTVFCAFDTETTGLASSYDRVIELGAVKFTRDGVLDTFSELFNPGMPLPDVCKTVSHITDDMVKDCPPIKDRLDAFKSFSQGTVLIAHNAQFDVKFINAELARVEKDCLDNEVIDTLALSRWSYPENGTWKLQSLAHQFNIDVHAAHRACDDARVCMEVFLRCIKDTMDKQQKPVQPPVSETEQLGLF